MLCEIHRLRATIPFADQLCNRLGEIGVAARADTTTKMLLENLAERLQQEPVCQERAGKAADTMRHLDKTAKKR